MHAPNNALFPSVEHLFPDPEEDDGTNDAEDKVLEVASSNQVYVKQGTDECAHIAAHHAYDDVHAAAFAFAAHDAVGYVSHTEARKDGPCCKLC